MVIQPSKLKIVKKQWYEISTPASLGKSKVGETYLAEKEPAIGRKLTVSYASISGDPQKQNINLRFRITKFEGNTFQTEVLGLELQSASLKRFVRKGRTKIEDSFLVKSKDNLTLRVKPFIVMRNNTGGTVRSILVKVIRDFLTTEIAKKEFELVVKELVNRQFQKAISNALKKISPAAIAEIRVLSIIEDEKKGAVKEAIAAPTETPAVEA